MLNFWNGYKTQIIAGVGVLISIALSQGWIDERLAVALGMAIGSTGLSTLRHAIAKTEKKVETTAATVSQQVAEVDAKAHQAALASTAVAEVVAAEPARIIVPDGTAR